MSGEGGRMKQSFIIDVSHLIHFPFMPRFILHPFFRLLASP